MKKITISILVSCIGIFILFLFHFNERTDTMLNRWDEHNKSEMHKIDQQVLREAVDYHKQEPAFARRPLSTFLFEKTSSLLHIEIGTSFVLVNFILFFLCGIAVFYLSVILKLSVVEAIMAQLLFYGGFTILCAFFNTNYTYDEPLTYLCCLLSLIAFFKQKHLLFFVWFLVACLSRESCYLFIPSILFLLLTQHQLTNKVRSFMLYSVGFILVLLLHAIILHFIYPSFFTAQSSQEMNSRMSLLEFNFQDIKFARETLLSLFLVLGFPLYLICKNWYLIHTSRNEFHIIIAFLFVLCINIPIVIFTTIARESRLFALPLLLIYPFLGKYMYKELLSFSQIRFQKINVLQIFFITCNLIFLFIAHHYFFTIYETTIHPKQYNFNGEYLFAIAFCMILLNCKDILTVRSE